MTKKNPKTRFQKIKAEAGERRCLFTGLPASRENLLRFVRDENGQVWPDLFEKLDGRGVWVSNNKAILQQVLKKQLFNSKGFGKGTKVPTDICETIENVFREHILNLIGLANKAGNVVFGFDKIKEESEKQKVSLLFEATDGSEKEEERLQVFLPDAFVIKLFKKEELGEKIGRDFCVHLAVLNGKIAENLKKEILRLQAFLSEG